MNDATSSRFTTCRDQEKFPNDDEPVKQKCALARSLYGEKGDDRKAEHVHDFVAYVDLESSRHKRVDAHQLTGRAVNKI